MIVTEKQLEITWEKLPETYILPDDPVDNIMQPALAFALEEILEIARLLTAFMLVATNFGIYAKVNKKIVVKAPDWVLIPKVNTTGHDRRSYTPNLDGDNPTIVMEFLSHTPGGEYSLDSSYPYGKMYFYQNILQVPIYVIFNPNTGRLEVRELRSGIYELMQPDDRNLYFLSPLKLYLGVWIGNRKNITGFWLRFWDENGNLLPWRNEEIQQLNNQVNLAVQEAVFQRQEKEKERQEKELAIAKAEILAERLRSLGIDPDTI